MAWAGAAALGHGRLGEENGKSCTNLLLQTVLRAPCCQELGAIVGGSFEGM